MSTGPASASGEPPPGRAMTAPKGTWRSSTRVNSWADFLLRQLCFAAALCVVLLVVLLVGILVWRSWESIEVNGLRFFTSKKWDPEPTHREFGALAFVWGTVITSLIAMALAIPFGVGTAAFLAEIAPKRLRKLGAFMVEMLAAIPSVVYGFWGLYVVAPALQGLLSALGGPNIGGVGLLPAGLVLGIMIVPYVAAVSYDVIRAVPRPQREGSLALGATRWQMIRTVVVPYAGPGIVGGCFLALGRALGETMAVTMLIGNRPDIVLSLFAKGNSIPSVIANEFTEATYDLYLSSLVELGLVLLLVSVGFSAAGRLLIWRVNRGRAGKAVFKLRLPGGRTIRPVHSAINGELSTAVSSSGQNNSPPLTDAPPNMRGAPSNSRRASIVNLTMTGILWFSFIATSVPLLLIMGNLLYKGGTALNWDFFTKLPAPVGQPGGGMANAFYGSFIMVAMATAFSVPIGLLAAVYLTEYRSKRFGSVVRFVAEMLGSVPSIVIGIFGYYAVVRPISGHFSGWAGAFALGVMMIPIVLRACEESLKLVPQSLRSGSYALGAGHWQTVARVIVPAALPAIITAVFLSIARVAGETAPLLLTASGNSLWPRSLNDFTPSLPKFIFDYANSGYEDWRRQAWAAAFVLVAAIMVLNFGIRLITGKRVLVASQAD